MGTKNSDGFVKACKHGGKTPGPREIHLGDLVELEKICQETRLLAAITGGTTSVFGLRCGELFPIDTESACMIAGSDFCRNMMQLDVSPCFNAHKKAGAKALETCRPVQRVCSCGHGILQSVPIILHYRGKAYPKAVVNTVFLHRPPDPQKLAAKLRCAPDELQRVLDGRAAYLIPKSGRDEILQTIIGLAEHISKEVSNAYSLLRANAKWRAAEANLHMEKQKLEATVRSVAAAFIIRDKRMRILWMNDVAEKWFGSKTHLLGKRNVLLNRELEAAGQSLCEPVLRTGDRQSTLCTITGEDSQTRHYRITTYPLPEGAPVEQVLERITDVTPDITARRRLETYHKLFNNLDDFVFLADYGSKMVVLNRNMRKELGYSNEELTDKRWKNLYPKEDWPIAERLRAEALEHGAAKGEIRLVSKDGRIYLTELLLTFSREERTFQGIYRDITERRSMERELEEKSRELEDKNRRILAAQRDRDRFFASVSHELRTPMTSIIGFTELLLEDAEDPVTPGQRVQLERIAQNAHKMLMLINDLLDLSKIEAGKMMVDLDHVVLPELVTQIVVNMQPLVRKKPVRLVTSIPPSLPSINTDEQKLSQILVNLISNAIKYTNKGKVVISAQVDESNVEISVADTGIGIGPEDLTTIFDEFHQAKTATSTRRAGTGLGLSIAQKLTKLLGGTIVVDSEPGRGSKFVVSLPLALTAPCKSSEGSNGSSSASVKKNGPRQH